MKDLRIEKWDSMNQLDESDYGTIRTTPEGYYVADITKTKDGFQLTFDDIEAMTRDIHHGSVIQWFYSQG